MSKEAKIIIAIAIVVVAAGVALAIFANPRSAEPGKAVDSQSLIRDTSHMTKSSSAKVNVVEFGDFECPACEKAYPEFKQLMEEYKDKDVNFVWREFPLESIHPNARVGAEAAEAAAKQGKFWEMHDLLYDKQSEWSTMPDPTDTLIAYAGSLGLDTDKFKVEMSQHLSKDIINADLKDADSLGLNGTPTFYVNGVKVDSQSVPSKEDLKKLIDEALNK